MKNETVIKAPIRIGQTLYVVEKTFNHQIAKITEATVEKIILTEKGLRMKLSHNKMYETSISALGKYIFETMEEAEEYKKHIVDINKKEERR